MGRVTIDPRDPPTFSPAELAILDALTPADSEQNARSDDDNPPLTEAELRRLRVAHQVRRVRSARDMTQAEFSETYRISLGRLRDWEQGRSEPDAMVMAYLETIRREPEAVARALLHSRDAA